MSWLYLQSKALSLYVVLKMSCVCAWLLLALQLGSNDCVELNEEEMSWVAFVILLRVKKIYTIPPFRFISMGI